MQREEVKKLLMVMDATYPNFKPTNLSDTIDAWTFALDGYEYPEISVALKNFMQSDTSGFAPTPGQLIGQIHSVEDLSDITELEATTMVMKAIRNSAYNSVREFEKLPPIVQRAVGSATQLKMWATTEDFNQTVVESNIQRVFRSVAKQEQSIRRMSPEMKSLADAYMQTRPQIENKQPKEELKLTMSESIDVERPSDEQLDGYSESLRRMLWG